MRKRCVIPADSSWCFPSFSRILEEMSRTRLPLSTAMVRSSRTKPEEGVGAWTCKSTGKGKGHPMFDHPKNALSVARTHQRELLQKEQMDRMARRVDSGQRRVPDRFVAVFHWTTLFRARARTFLRGRARRPEFRQLPQRSRRESARLEDLSHRVRSN
jgi:hypothetical protein